MDFEYIDESEVVSSRRGRNGGQKKEKKITLFDSELTDRSYWGVIGQKDGEPVIDPGTLLLMSIMRNRIRHSIDKGFLLDVAEEARKLNSEFIKELVEYQFQYLFDLMSDGLIVAHQAKDGKWLIEKI